MKWPINIYTKDDPLGTLLVIAVVMFVTALLMNVPLVLIGQRIEIAAAMIGGLLAILGGAGAIFLERWLERARNATVKKDLSRIAYTRLQDRISYLSNAINERLSIVTVAISNFEERHVLDGATEYDPERFQDVPGLAALESFVLPWDEAACLDHQTNKAVGDLRRAISKADTLLMVSLKVRNYFDQLGVGLDSLISAREDLEDLDSELAKVEALVLKVIKSESLSD